MNEDLLLRDAMQSVALPWQVVCPSVCLSVTLRYRGQLMWLKFLENNFTASLIFPLSADPNITGLLQREHPKF